MNGNFQEKRISADSDYGQQSSGKNKTMYCFYEKLLLLSLITKIN